MKLSDKCRTALVAAGKNSAADMEDLAFGLPHNRERNRVIVQAVVFDGHTLKSQAEIHGMSGENVRAICARVTRRCLGSREFLRIGEGGGA